MKKVKAYGHQLLLLLLLLLLDLCLKLVSAIFYQFFIFSPNDGPSKTEKFFYFI